MSYKARKFGTFASLEEAARVVQQEFEAVEESAELMDILVLQVLHAAPDKFLPGMVVYADGSDWDPGSGEGLYRRDKTNTSWVFIG
jgi:hypothetical protein